MLFNSIDFAIFFPLVYLAYWQLGRRAQNVLLLVASYVFYGWWDWRFLGLIAFSSALDYGVGLALADAESPRRRRALLAVSLLANLGLLGFFKYCNFFIDTAADALRLLGYEPSMHALAIVLPVGISFYTFQTLSYTIDLYRRQIPVERDAIAFFSFVAFFPQLVAGPIERAHHLLGQFSRDRHFDREAAALACGQIAWGLCKKVVVADTLSGYVDAAYGNPAADGTALALATLYFAFQIYCDFSGYSDIAIGCARLFGFDLMRNFAFPYFSRDVGEFWRRWHISLSTWFRDYVFIPLGGSRVGPWKLLRNALATFVLSGFWHGANLTFVAWGFLHAVLYAVSHRFVPKRRGTDIPGGEGALPGARALVEMGVTFVVVCFAWIFFRADSLAHAFRVIGTIATDTDLAGFFLVGDAKPRALIGALVAIEWWHRDCAHPFEALRGHPFAERALAYALVAALVLLGGTANAPFVYFQF
ncbi:MAG: MBOAT family protein [Myxococcales bacterium]|nr:MBOAT family protein [Myxococcales bacterium]